MTGRTGQGGRVRSLQDKQQQCVSERAVAMTGRATSFDRTRCTQRPIGVQRAPRAIGRIWSHVTGRATASNRHKDTRCPLGAWPDALVPRGTGRAGPWPSRVRLCLRFELTERAGPPGTASSPAFGWSFSEINTLDYRHLFSPLVQWKIGISFPQNRLNREHPKPLFTAQTPPPSQMC
jgi:hypothetical protein